MSFERYDELLVYLNFFVDALIEISAAFRLWRHKLKPGISIKRTKVENKNSTGIFCDIIVNSQYILLVYCLESWYCAHVRYIPNLPSHGLKYRYFNSLCFLCINGLTSNEFTLPHTVCLNNATVQHHWTRLEMYHRLICKVDEVESGNMSSTFYDDIQWLPNIPSFWLRTFGDVNILGWLVYIYLFGNGVILP